jgi:GNAT superfamily N-acetyltransferase
MCFKYNKLKNRPISHLPINRLGRRGSGVQIAPPRPNLLRIPKEFFDLGAGLAHCLFHRSTSQIQLICCLQDLYTLPSESGRGIGRSLIEAVCTLYHRS